MEDEDLQNQRTACTSEMASQKKNNKTFFEIGLVGFLRHQVLGWGDTSLILTK